MNRPAILKTLRVLTGTFSSLRAVESSQESVTQQKQLWAEKMLRNLCFEVSVHGTSTSQRPAVFVGSHLSYLDIPLLLSVVPDLNFVAKAELEKWPLFGPGMRKLHTIFVERDSRDSRNKVKETLRHALQAEAKAVLVFPSGTTCLHEQKPWKPGAFRLAAETGVPLQPFRIRYSPLRTAAFIDNDGFLAHIYKVGRLKKLQATLEFAPVVEKISKPEAECARWQSWAAEGL